MDVIPGVLFLISVVILILLLGGVLYEQTMRVRDRVRFGRQPGEMVGINGHRLHVQQMGTAKDGPTVVLEAGIGGNSLDWSLVLPRVAEFAHVIAYDRAGYAWSEAGPRPRTPEQIVMELVAMLDKIGAEPPFILAGHSFGGFYARLYAEQHPENVAGIVLVDASSDAMLKDEHGLDEIKRLKRVLFFQQLGLVRLMIGRLLLHVQALPNKERKRYLAMNLRGNETTLHEAKPVFTEGIHLADSLGAMPLLVVSRSVIEESKSSQKWHSYQKGLLSLSTNSRHIVGEKGSHYIHLADPELVVDAIREMVELAQAQQNISA